ncbi:MAG: helical backbone metal receptor, partial [Bryobacteraceae bacterium]
LRRLALLPFLLAMLLAASPPSRIVSTAPSITEMLYALGLGPSVVGDTTYCTYPADARAKPKIGTFLDPDLERILALRPDLVLVIKNPIGVTAKLRSLGLRAEELDQDSVAGILASLLRIGQLTGRDAQAARLTTGLRAQLDSVRRLAASRPRRSVLFLVGRAPGTLQGMVGAGPGTFIDELLTLAGASNVLASSPMQYPNVSLEQILTRDPEVILDMGDFAHAEGRPGQPPEQILALWAAYPRLRAVSSRRVQVIASDVFVRPGPRMAEAARALFGLIHPEASPRPEVRPT